MKRLPKKYSFVLWGIVAVRMLFDLRISSVLSLFNLFPVSDGESQPLLKDYQMSRIMPLPVGLWWEMFIH